MSKNVCLLILFKILLYGLINILFNDKIIEK